MKRRTPSRSFAGKKSAGHQHKPSTASTETSTASIETSTEATEPPGTAETASQGQASGHLDDFNCDASYFIQYQPEIAEKLSKHNSNHSVSGRCLSIVFSRMMYWSKYAKHRYEGKLFFWKNQVELSQETSFSTKQINRALKVLVELGLLVRQKFQKHFWRQVYFYHLPHSPHTKELKRQPPSRTRSISTSSSNRRNSGRQPQQFHRGTPAPVPAAPPPERTSVPPVAAGGADASGSARPAVVPMDQGRVSVPRETKCPYQSQDIPSSIKHTLKSIVERCNTLGKVGYKDITE